MYMDMDKRRPCQKTKHESSETKRCGEFLPFAKLRRTQRPDPGARVQAGQLPNATFLPGAPWRLPHVDPASPSRPTQARTHRPRTGNPALTVRHCTRMEVRAPRILRPCGASEPCERSGRGSNFRPRTPEADLEPMRTTGSPVLPRRASPVEPRTKIRVARPLDASDFPSTDGQGGSHRDGPGVDLGENPFII